MSSRRFAAWASSPSARCSARPSTALGPPAGIAALGLAGPPAADAGPVSDPGVRAGRFRVVRSACAGHVPGPAHGHQPDDRRVRPAWRARGGGRPVAEGIVSPWAGWRSRPSVPRSGRRARATGASSSDVSGQDFATLVMQGWVPAGLVLGISIGSRHDDRTTARQARWRPGNAEVTGWTELVTQSRRDARCQLQSDVRRLGAEGVVIATMQMRVRERDCPVNVGRRDHIVEATLIGTAIVRFSHAGRRHAGPAPRRPGDGVPPRSPRSCSAPGRGDGLPPSPGEWRDQRMAGGHRR